MAHLVTLAHRVSRVYSRYAEIHSAAFAFSLRRGAARWGKTASHCRHEEELSVLKAELSEVLVVIDGAEVLEPSTTLGSEFSLTLREYAVALSDTLDRLSRICGRLCRDDTGAERYGVVEARDDRVAYDDSIQRYRRFGHRLHILFARL